MGRVSKPATEQVCRAAVSLPSCWSLWSWERCGCSFLGWGPRNVPLVLSRYKVSRSGASEVQSASASTFAEAMGTELPWDAEVQGAPSQGCSLAPSENIQPFPLAFQHYLPQQKSASFLSHRATYLLLPHSVGSKHRENKPSLDP